MINKTKEKWVKTFVIKRLKQRGRGRIAQEAGAIYAGFMLQEGKTGANSIHLGIKIGLSL